MTRRWWLLPVLVVLVIGAGAAAGYGLHELTAQASGDQEGPPAAPAITTTATPGEAPGPRAVELAPDVKADPGSADVQKLLQRHFDAINNGDYESWQATVTRQRAAGYPKQKWQVDYSSTKDGSILVHRIEPTTAGSVVLISFTSTQDLARAPNQQSECVRWRVGYLVVVLGQGELRLGPTEQEASQHIPC